MKFVGPLLEALELQTAIAERLAPDRLGLPSPCEGWSVRDTLNHSLAVTEKLTRFASGVTDRPRTLPGNLLGSDHIAATRRVTAESAMAWRQVDWNRACHLPFGSFTAGDAAGINLYDALAHTWDIAVGGGLVLSGRDELWEAGLAAARRVLAAQRDTAHYRPERAVEPNAPARVRFLAFLGREPGPEAR